MKNIWVTGVDLGKNSCSLVGLDASGRVVLRRRVRRDGVVGLVLKFPIYIVAMEAGCGPFSQPAPPSVILSLVRICVILSGR
jgi:transposase